MNENAKTLAFLAVGVVALVGGWFISTPSPPPDDSGIDLASPFFADFTDPLKVASAEIVDFDATTDTKHDLKAARVDDVWELNPEKQGYPEVSTARLADVVKAVSGLKKLSIVTDDRSQHRAFGVVDPGSAAELKEGSEGVGKRVTLLDERKKPLVDLIVGKVDDKNPKLHYVRRPDKDRIYRTEIETDPLSSRFDDWVKPDLLGVGTAELRAVRINDQSIDVRNMQQGAGGGIVMVRKVPVRIEKARAELAKDGENKWQPKKLETYDKEKKTFVPAPIADGEEIDAAKLSDLGRALKDVKIVDVMKKPKLLAEDLQAPVNFLSNPNAAVLKDLDSADALQLAGFFPNPNPLGGLELICHEGDMSVGFSDGVQYMLRFGDITGKGRGAAEGEKKEDAKAGEAKPDETKAAGAVEGGSTSPNRYLFVTASFNPDLIPKPKLEELPPETPAAAAPPAKDDAAKKEPVANPAADAKPAEAKPEEKKEEPKSPSKVDAADDAKESSCDQEPEKKDEPKPSATAAPAASPTATPAASATASKPAEPAKPAPTATATGTKPAETAKPADAAKPADDKPAEAKPAEAKPAELAKPAMTPEERKRIETENKEKQAKYEADLKAGEEKAKKLNAQFAGWFYVVSDATFQGLNLDPTTLVKKPSPPTPPAGGPPAGFPGLGLPPGLVPPQ